MSRMFPGLVCYQNTTIGQEKKNCVFFYINLSTKYIHVLYYIFRFGDVSFTLPAFIKRTTESFSTEFDYKEVC